MSEQDSFLSMLNEAGIEHSVRSTEETNIVSLYDPTGCFEICFIFSIDTESLIQRTVRET
jgi:hypothetical protein